MAAFVATVALGAAAAPSVATPGEATLDLSPGAGDVATDGSTELAVVVSSAEGGVGAVELDLSVADPDVARIASVELIGAPRFERAEVNGNGRTASVSAAGLETSASATTLVGVTVEGRSTGTTELELSVDALGDEAGDSYDVSLGNRTAAVSVGSAATPTATPAADDDGDDGGDGDSDAVVMVESTDPTSTAPTAADSTPAASSPESTPGPTADPATDGDPATEAAVTEPASPDSSTGFGPSMPLLVGTLAVAALLVAYWVRS